MEEIISISRDDYVLFIGNEEKLNLIDAICNAPIYDGEKVKFIRLLINGEYPKE